MKMNPRLAAIGVAIVVAGLTLAGCSSTTTTSGKGWTIPSKDPKATITVLSAFGLDLASGGDMQPVLNAFEKAHPSIKVKWELAANTDLDSALSSRLGNKDASLDLFWADQPTIGALALRGYVEDLTKQFAPYKSAWEQSAYDGSSFEGKLYGVPTGTSTQLLYYNKGLLSAAEITPPSADPASPASWEDLANLGKQAQAKGGAKYGLTLAQSNAYYQLEPLPVSLGGSPGGTGKGNLTPDVASEPWVKAMTFYGSLFADKIAPRGTVDNGADFLAGKTAFIVNGSWMIDQLVGQTKVDWGVAPSPKFADGKEVTPTGSWDVAMSPYSKNKAAASIFMKWLTVDNGGNISRYRAAPDLPANNDGLKLYLEKPVFKTPVGQDAAKILFYQAANTGVPRLETVGYDEFQTIIGKTFSDIANGADPKTALDAANVALKSAWAKYSTQ